MILRASLVTAALFLFAIVGMQSLRTDGRAMPSTIPVATSSIFALPIDTILDDGGGAVAETAADDASPTPMPEIDSRFEPVVQRLVSDGWPERWVREHFADERTEFIPKMVVVKPKTKSGGSGSSAYKWVNTTESARACIEFIERYSQIFDSAEEKYGVPREMIASLMRVETRHGKVTGDYHVFSVYASMTLMTDRNYLAENLKNAEESLRASRASESAVVDALEYIRNRSDKRGNWAYRELVNLLEIHRDEKLDGMAIYGSWAGAFGWSQFLPSSYQRSAVDGNGDGRIDLFDPADAIHSVGNYLKGAGYRQGNTSRMRKALFNYNNSTPYVNSIMGLYNRVKRMQG